MEILTQKQAVRLANDRNMRLEVVGDYKYRSSAAQCCKRTRATERDVIICEDDLGCFLVLEFVSKNKPQPEETKQGQAAPVSDQDRPLPLFNAKE